MRPRTTSSGREIVLSRCLSVSSRAPKGSVAFVAGSYGRDRGQRIVLAERGQAMECFVLRRVTKRCEVRRYDRSGWWDGHPPRSSALSLEYRLSGESGGGDCLAQETMDKHRPTLDVEDAELALIGPDCLG